MTKFEVDNNREILVTSYFKTISGNRIDKLVSNSMYKLQYAALKLNGFSPEAKLKRSDIHNKYGASFDYENNAFRFLGKTIMDYDFVFSGNGMYFDVRIYDIETGEQFSKEEIDSVVGEYSTGKPKTEKVDFSESLEYLRSLANEDTDKKSEKEESAAPMKRELTKEEIDRADWIRTFVGQIGNYKVNIEHLDKKGEYEMRDKVRNRLKEDMHRLESECDYTYCDGDENLSWDELLKKLYS